MATFLIELLGPAGIIASSLLITVTLFSGTGYLIGTLSKFGRREEPTAEKR